MIDATDALTFLDHVQMAHSGMGLLNLVAIDPTTGKPTGDSFGPQSVEAQRDFIERHAPTRNLYFGLNPLAQKPANGKAKKSDVGHLVILGVDLDPKSPATQEEDMRAHRARLEAFALPPSVLIDSGRGLQALWILKDPVHVNGNLTC